MDIKNQTKQISIIFVASLIIGLGLSYPGKTLSTFLSAFTTMLIIISINTFAKKIFAHNLELDTENKFWTTYYFGLKKREHFKSPLTMVWLPLLTTMITFGNFVWMSIIEFDVKSRPERVSRRHGLYRFTEATQWHIALIAVAGIFANVFFGILGYFLGFEYFTKLSIIYAFWMIIPIGRLDGSKIFFGNRTLWFSVTIVLLSTLLWGLSIV